MPRGQLVVKLLVRVALGAALALAGGTLFAGGELERRDEPARRAAKTEEGRESKIRVYLPTSEAKLYVDGTLTRLTGGERLFRAPGLSDTKRYTYRLLAVYVENGREVTHEAWVTFWGGEDVAVSFRR
jgi:uncharacterized protein (TIGR03000 family)